MVTIGAPGSDLLAVTHQMSLLYNHGGYEVPPRTFVSCGRTKARAQGETRPSLSAPLLRTGSIRTELFTWQNEGAVTTHRPLWVSVLQVCGTRAIRAFYEQFGLLDEVAQGLGGGVQKMGKRSLWDVMLLCHHVLNVPCKE